MTTRVVRVPGMGDVHFPAEMSDAQVAEAIRRNLGSPDNDPERAKRMAALQQSRRNIDADNQRLAQDAAPRGWERVGRGALDVGQGVNQLVLQGTDAAGLTEGAAPAYTQRVNAELGRYDAARANAGETGFDWLRLGGQAMATAPTMLLPGAAATGVAGRMGAGAFGGGVSGAAMFTPSGTMAERARNAATGAALGAVTAPITGYATDKMGAGLKALFGRFRGRVAQITEQDILQALPEAQALTAEAQRDLVAEAQAMVRQTGQFDAEQLARKANLLSQGAKPTTSMVTRNPADWARERNLSKLGQSPDPRLAGMANQLTDVYQANDAAFASRLGAPAASQEAQGMTVMRSIADLAETSQDEVSKLYGAVETQRGAELAADARNLFGKLDDLRDSTAADSLTQSVLRRLKRFGMVDDAGALTSQSLTVKQAEELRKFINAQPSGYGKRDLIAALDEDVLGGLGEDAYSAARGAARERFRMLGNPATQRALDTFGELTQGKTAQSFIRSQVVNGADQDVQSLVQTLNQIPDASRRTTALAALRDGVLAHLREKAINPNGGQFSGAGLNKALEALGDQKLALIFGPDQAAQLRSLARAALDATYQPPYAAVNASNTAPMLMSLIERGRGVAGVNLPLGLNEAAQASAARSGYARQLAEALAARGRAPAAQVSPRLARSAEELALALRAAAPPATYGAIDQARKRAQH